MSKKSSKTDWAKFDAIPEDRDIDDLENPELGDDFFANAKLVMPQPKRSLSVRFDADLVAWYKAAGPGYQTRMNAVLRMFMQEQQRRQPKAR